MAKEAKMIDQKAYLQKYLSKDKKKKKKRVTKGTGLKLIDEDIDLSRLRPLDADELDFDPRDEDAPQIAGIVDERPDHLKTLETFRSSKWKVVSSNDGIDEQFNIEEVSQNHKKKKTETQDIIFGKMYSDSEDEKDRKKSDSDISPPRSRLEKKDKPQRKKDGCDSDTSPPRNRLETKDKSKRKKDGSDSDISPPRNRLDTKDKSKRKKYGSDSDISPPRSRLETKDKRNNRKDSDSDLSPPRKNDVSGRPRKKSRWGDNDSEIVETFNRQERKDDKRYDSPNLSPSRKKDNKNNDRNKRRNDESTKRKNSDSDLSPVRNRKDTKERNRKRSKSPPLVKDRRDDKDRWKHDKYEELMSKNYKRKERYRKDSEDSDLSPPRKERNINRKADKTLEGKKAGLQDANALVRENAEFRRKENELYKKMAADVSGRNAKTVSRNLGKRESSADRERKRHENEKRKEIEAKYDKWGKGLKQVQQEEDRMRDMAEEGARPLARYKDDERLDAMLRERDREGDPMLDYIREKRTESGGGQPSRPVYKGDFPPNRYNIRPGYRWDGVDRSNGYEKKYFDAKSKNKAREEEALKWSTEDL